MLVIAGVRSRCLTLCRCTLRDSTHGIPLMRMPSSARRSWIGAAFPADAAREPAPHAVNRDKRARGVAERKQQAVPRWNAKIRGARDVQAECRCGAERCRDQARAACRTAVRAI